MDKMAKGDSQNTKPGPAQLKLSIPPFLDRKPSQCLSSNYLKSHLLSFPKWECYQSCLSLHPRDLRVHTEGWLFGALWFIKSLRTSTWTLIISERSWVCADAVTDWTLGLSAPRSLWFCPVYGKSRFKRVYGNQEGKMWQRHFHGLTSFVFFSKYMDCKISWHLLQLSKAM